MSIRLNKYSIPNLIQPQHILISVSDKKGLKDFVSELYKRNPKIMFYSTGGSAKVILEALGENEKSHANFKAVEELSGTPEMEGGLVKTLTPQIFAGLLAERNNPAHEEYLEHTLHTQHTIPQFDMCIVNFYPFEETIANPQTQQKTEEARCNIDIGGPSMVAASAKNWHSVAVLTEPSQYEAIIEEIDSQGGISAKTRFNLSCKANKKLAAYRSSIADYYDKLDFSDVIKDIKLQK